MCGLAENNWWANAAEELPIQRFRSIAQHFRHVNYQSSSSKTGFIPDDLLGTPQKTLLPQYPRFPEPQKSGKAWGRLWGRWP